MKRAMAIGTVCAFFVGALASIGTEPPPEPDYVPPLYAKAAQNYGGGVSSGRAVMTASSAGTSGFANGSVYCTTSPVTVSYVQQ